MEIEKDAALAFAQQLTRRGGFLSEAEQIQWQNKLTELMAAEEIYAVISPEGLSIAK